MARIGLLVMATVWVVFVAAGPSARADQACVYQVFATNEADPSARECKDFDQSLQKVFPNYKHFYLVAKKAAELREHEPVKLSLERGMSVLVDPVSVDANVWTLEVSVRHGPTQLLNSRVRMTGGAPLVIKGIERDGGLRILVLLVR
jgi:hypothetical protein